MPSSMPKPPLTDKDYSKINEMLSKANQLQMEIDRAGQAGFPCDEMDAECKARAVQWQKIKSAYFPERP